MFRHILPALLLLTLLIACGPQPTPLPTPDVGAIQTAAAQTVIAEIRVMQNAAASLTPQPTPTTEPTATPTEETTPVPTFTVVVGIVQTPALTNTPLGALCDDSSYDPATVDVNYPDGSVMAPGQEFLKKWLIRNTGTCTWGAGYRVIFAYGERMNGTPAPLNVPVIPNQETEVAVQFRVPTRAGQYTSTWRLANAFGTPFGVFFYVKIIVQ